MAPFARPTDLGGAARPSPARRRVAAAACAVGTTAAALLAQPAPAPGDEPFREAVTVREVGVIVQAPRRSVDPAAALAKINVHEGDLELTASGLSALASGGSRWRSLVYVDLPLSSGATVRRATLALGSAAEALVALGSLEVRVADPAPRTVLAATTDPHAVAEALAAVAKRAPEGDALLARRTAAMAALGKAPPPSTLAAAVGEEVAQLQRQIDHLLLTAVEGCPQAPCALFLVSDGWDLLLTGAWGAAAGAPGSRQVLLDAADRVADASEALVEVLASYGWVTIALPLRVIEEGRKVQPPSWATSPSEADFQPLLRLWPFKRRPAETPATVFEVAVAPRLAPLRALVEATAGTITQTADELPAAVERLGGLWTLSYRTPREPDGRIEPVTVTWGAKEVPAQAYVRGGTTEAATAARLRAALDAEDGAGTPGNVAVSAHLTPTADGSRLEVEVAAGAFGDPRETPGPVRISAVWRGEEGWMSRHELLTGVPAEGAALHHALALSATPRRVAVAVETVAAERWGSTVATLPLPGG